jgi:hypothetical protein
MSVPERSLNSGAIADVLTENSKKSVPFVLPAVAEKLHPLHKLERGLLWREQRPITKESIHFVIDEFRELSDTPSYCIYRLQKTRTRPSLPIPCVSMLACSYETKLNMASAQYMWELYSVHLC